MRLLITGASGFIGSAVVAELARGGHQVTGLARSAALAERLAALGAAVVRASLSDPGALHAAAAASDGVLHLADRHGDPYPDAAGTDRQVIEVIGDALTRSGRPLVVTSGTLVLPAGQVATEAGTPAPAGARAAGETAALSLAGRGVRAVVLRLAPVVHDGVRRGFAAALADIAERAGFSAYLGDGSQRWPAVHRQDAARLYRLAAERAPAGSVLHGVGEEGVSVREIACRIASHLGVPARAIPPDQAEAHFGWLAGLVATDAPASSAATRSLMGWEPSHRGLLDDLDQGQFFPRAQR
jgi:nucleoside-diphosphate-sugar epimerase